MSHVTCHMYFFFDKLVKLIGGGSVINGAYPFYFYLRLVHCTWGLVVVWVVVVVQHQPGSLIVGIQHPHWRATRSRLKGHTWNDTDTLAKLLVLEMDKKKKKKITNFFHPKPLINKKLTLGFGLAVRLDLRCHRLQSKVVNSGQVRLKSHGLQIRVWTSSPVKLYMSPLSH